MLMMIVVMVTADNDMAARMCTSLICRICMATYYWAGSAWMVRYLLYSQWIFVQWI